MTESSNPSLPAALPLAEADVDRPAAGPDLDHELMLAVRGGSIEMLGEIFERHHRPLYGFFVRLTGQRTASEDLVQQVFQRILRYRHTYRDEGRFSAWIYHIARRVAADHFRQGGLTHGDPTGLESLPDPAPHAAENAAAGDDLALMHQALGKLAPDDREILVLFRLQGLAQAEIGRLLGCRTGTVKVRVHRALQSLRQLYFNLRQEKSP